MFVYKSAETHHENYRQLIWELAKADFKLRYQNSILGYIWAILQPLLIFTVINFVFSSVFRRSIGGEYYSLGLLVSLVLFFFFSDGTKAGMRSLVSKSSLVVKIYVPRWTIIMASTIHSTMVFSTNLLVVIAFFIWYGFLPSIKAVLLFFMFSMVMYVLILSIALLTAPLFVKFRDMGEIWTVALRVMFYATPIIYPLQMLPDWIQRTLLMNPVAFIVHFTKGALLNNHYAEFWKFALFFASSGLFFLFCVGAYRLLIPQIAEKM